MKTFKQFYKALSKEGRADLANYCGTSTGYLEKIMYSKDLYFSAAMARKIEDKSGGIVSRKDLRPNDWKDIWTELKD